MKDIGDRPSIHEWVSPHVLAEAIRGMEMQLFFLALLIALAPACMPNSGTTPASESATIVPAAEEAARDDIIGEYVVEMVNGAPPAINFEGHEPTVTISPQRIHFQSQCIYADWTYEREGERISTKPYYEPGSEMCARGLEPGETAIQAGIDKATSVRRTRQGLQLEGGEYRLVLHRR
jgi:hypothetical protein